MLNSFHSHSGSANANIEKKKKTHLNLDETHHESCLFCFRPVLDGDGRSD